MTSRIIRRPEVQHLTGLSRSTLYARIAEGNFPKPVPLGGRLVGWLESDIQNWINSCSEASQTLSTAQEGK